MCQSRSHSLIIAVVAIALVGCTTKVDIELPPKGERATVIEKLPLTVGILYGQRFRNYINKGCNPWGSPPRNYTDHSRPYCDFRIDINMGPANVALFNRTMRALFSQVKIVGGRSQASRNSQALAAIIEPKIFDYQYSLYASMTQGYYAAKITYRLVLRTVGGDELAQWSVSGEAKDAINEYASFSTGVGKATQSALRAVEAKMLTEFHEQPGVRRWLSSLGIDEKVGSERNDK